MVLQSLSPEEAQSVLQGSGLISKLSQSDPLAAAELLSTYGTSENNHHWQSVGRYYAAQDPEKAYAWASSLPPEQQKQALAGVIQRMAESDGLGAFQKAQLLEDKNSRENTMENVLRQWVNSDPEGMEKAVPQMSGDTRTGAQNFLIAQKSQNDPSEAADYLLGLQRSSNPDDQKAAASNFHNLGEHWARLNPKAAAAWGSQLPPGESQDRFIQGMASQWVQVDAFNASIWIKDLPAGKGRDYAVVNLVTTIKESDPDSALVWAGQIQDEGQRQSAFENSLRAYLKKDPAAGRRAVEASSWSPERKAQFLQSQ